jgi:hypothetical protein
LYPEFIGLLAKRIPVGRTATEGQSFMSRYYTMLRCVVRSIPRKMQHVGRKRERPNHRPFNWRHIMLGSAVSTRAASIRSFGG